MSQSQCVPPQLGSVGSDSVYMECEVLNSKFYSIEVQTDITDQVFRKKVPWPNVLNPDGVSFSSGR